MLIQRWSVFGPIDRLGGHTNSHIKDVIQLKENRTVSSWRIPIDVKKNDGSLLISASLPGFSKNEIEVSFKEHDLTIKAESAETQNNKSNEYLLREHHTGTGSRAIRLPKNLDIPNAKLTFQDGVLMINIPLRESPKARKLDISAA